MMKLVPVFLIVAAFIPVANAQHISVGIAAGFPLTDGMSNFSTVANQITTHDYSNSKLYLLGPMVDLRLPLNFGIEIDALYCPVNLTVDSQTALGPIIRKTRTSFSFATWEFPVLGKYRLPRSARDKAVYRGRAELPRKRLQPLLSFRPRIHPRRRHRGENP